MKIGYARVSTRSQASDGNSLEAQKRILEDAGAEKIYSDIFTGVRADRPNLEIMLDNVRSGDTIIVTKLDRIARSVTQGNIIIDKILNSGCYINILNIGCIDGSASGRMLRNILFSFAEFERDLIQERTKEGKEIARKNPDYKEGRPDKYNAEQKKLAIELLKENSYKKVSEMTGISVSTLFRIMKKAVNTA